MSLDQHECSWFQNKQHKKNTNFGQKGGGGGCNKTFFFVIKLCFQKCEKLSFLFPLFLAKFWLMFKNTVKIGISAHFQK